jgi:hypothetical protein
MRNVHGKTEKKKDASPECKQIRSPTPSGNWPALSKGGSFPAAIIFAKDTARERKKESKIRNLAKTKGGSIHGCFLFCTQNGAMADKITFR